MLSKLPRSAPSSLSLSLSLAPTCGSRPTYHPDLSRFIPYVPELDCADYSRYPSPAQVIDRYPQLGRGLLESPTVEEPGVKTPDFSQSASTNTVEEQDVSISSFYSYYSAADIPQVPVQFLRGHAPLPRSLPPVRAALPPVLSSAPPMPLPFTVKSRPPTAPVKISPQAKAASRSTKRDLKENGKENRLKQAFSFKKPRSVVVPMGERNVNFLANE